MPFKVAVLRDLVLRAYYDASFGPTSKAEKKKKKKTNALAANGCLLREVAIFHGVLSTLTPLH